MASIVKYWIRIDDSMDVFAEHGVAGGLGLLANAIFASDAIIGLDGVNVGLENPTTGTLQGGWIIQNYRQLYIQLAYILAVCGYAFVMSAIIAYLINITPGLKLRASEEAELLGMDDDQLGEFAYDYVEVRRDYLAWTPQKAAQLEDGHEIPHADRYGIGAHSEMIEGHNVSSEEVSRKSQEITETPGVMQQLPRQVAERNPLGQEHKVADEEKAE